MSITRNIRLGVFKFIRRNFDIEVPRFYQTKQFLSTCTIHCQSIFKEVYVILSRCLSARKRKKIDISHGIFS